jgi:hypothetical protein
MTTANLMPPSHPKNDNAIAEGILFRAGQITGYYPSTIRLRNRVQALMRTRQAVIYAVHQRTEWPSGMISRFVGLTNHTTVLYHYDKAATMLSCCPKFSALVAELMAAPPIKPLTATEALRAAGVKSIPPPPVQSKTATRIKIALGKPEKAKKRKADVRARVEPVVIPEPVKVAKVRPHPMAVASQRLALAVLDALIERRAA